MNTKEIYKSVVSLVKFSSQQYFVFYVIYNLIKYILLVPLAFLGFNFLLISSGNTAYNDFDLASFLLTPLGVITILFLFSAILFIEIIGSSGFMTIAYKDIKKDKLSITQICFHVISKIKGILVSAFIIVFSTILIAIPFLFLAAFVYSTLLKGTDLNYYLAYWPTDFKIAVLLFGIIIFSFLVFVALALITQAYVLPSILFQNLDVKTSIKNSYKLAKAHFSKVFFVVVSWVLVVVVLIASFNYLYWALARFVFKLVDYSIDVVLFYTVFIVITNFLCILLLDFIRASTTSVLLFKTYVVLQEQKNKDFVTELKPLNTKNKVNAAPKMIIWGGLFLFAIFLGYLGAFCVSIYGNLNTDIIAIAHRGSPNHAPENTLASFQKALDENTDVIELDVHSSSDGVVTVIHDKDTKRVTGELYPIYSTQYAVLKTLDAGSYFSPEFSDQYIPTLQDVFDLVQGQTVIDIELKYDGHDPDIAKKTLDVVNENNMQDKVIMMSLDYKTTQKAKDLTDTIPVGLLASVFVGDISKQNIDFLAVSGRSVNRRLIHEAHKNGIDIYAWTINDPKDMAQLMVYGVDGLITDNVPAVHKVTKEMSTLSEAQRFMLYIASIFGFTKEINSTDI